MEPNRWNKILSEYITPAYVFDLDLLGVHIKELKEILGQRAELCYAMKANPFLVAPMKQWVRKFEVCSPGEFRICEREAIPMEQIVLSGVNKEKKEIERIFDIYNGKGTYTVESMQQLLILQECAFQRDLVIEVLLRITSGNQFGLDEDTVKQVVCERNQYSAIHIKGIQYYSGTQKKKLSKIEKELMYLDNFCDLLKDLYNYEVEEIEYGPGFYISYFEKEERIDQKQLLLDFENALDAMRFSGKITLEMGRYITATCGYYLTKIIDQKMNNGQRYCIIDGGINHINYYGQTMAMKVPNHLHISEVRGEHVRVDDTKDADLWNVCGSLCTIGDVIVKNLPLHNVKVNDYLVFENLGAYSITEGIYLFLSRDLPKVFFYQQGKELQLVRGAIGTDNLNSIQR